MCTAPLAASSPSASVALSRLVASCPASCWPQSIFVHGPPQSGKTTLVEDVIFDRDKVDGAACVVSCVSGAIHSRLVLQDIVRSLAPDDPPEVATGVANLADLVKFLKERFGDGGNDGGVIIALKNAERLRDMDANLLPGFLRLKELTRLPVCVLLISKIAWSKFMVPSGLPRPVPVIVRQFTKEQMSKVIADKLKERQARDDLEHEKDLQWEDEFFLNYTSIVISMFIKACRTLPELEYLCQRHYAAFRDPVVRGDVEQHNVRALYRAIEKELKESLATLHLQETTSRQLKEIQRRENLESLEGVQKQNRRLHVELPFHSKFLLIAAYLASYNPAKSDKRFFVKHHGKQRKTKAGIAAKERAVSSQLTGPKAFPLDRLMAIFYSVVDDEVAPSANIQGQIASLVTLQFLMSVGSDDCLDMPKFKCNVGLEFISQMSRQVGFEIQRYLYDFA